MKHQTFAARIGRSFNQLSKTSEAVNLPIVTWACYFTDNSSGRLNATTRKVFIQARDENEAQKKFAVWANLAWYPLANPYALQATRRVVACSEKLTLVKVLQSMVML